MIPCSIRSSCLRFDTSKCRFSPSFSTLLKKVGTGERDMSAGEHWALLDPFCRSSVSPFQLPLSTYFPPDTTNHKRSPVHPPFKSMTLLVVHTVVLSGGSRCPIPSFPPVSSTVPGGPLVPLHARRTSPRGQCSSHGHFPWASLFHRQQSISPCLGMYLLIGT